MDRIGGKGLLYLTEEFCSDDLADLWVGPTGEKISDETKNEIVDNLAGFFRVLNEWNGKSCQRKTAANAGRKDDCETKAEEIDTGRSILYFPNIQISAVTSGAA